MRVKDEYEVRIYGKTPQDLNCKGVFPTLDEADKQLEHTDQCTWDDIEEQSPESYSVIFHYRDDEHYNDFYFINRKYLQHENKAYAGSLGNVR